jgi:hypothetical protein
VDGSGGAGGDVRLHGCPYPRGGGAAGGEEGSLAVLRGLMVTQSIYVVNTNASEQPLAASLFPDRDLDHLSRIEAVMILEQTEQASSLGREFVGAGYLVARVSWGLLGQVLVRLLDGHVGHHTRMLGPPRSYCAMLVETKASVEIERTWCGTLNMTLKRRAYQRT